MGKTAQTTRGRGRIVAAFVLAVATLVVVAVLAPSAFAFGAWNHGGAGCASCHPGGDTGVPGTNAACQACHTSYERRAAATQDCWSCHAPGQDMTPSKQQTGCTGVCHTQTSGTSYTTDITPHGASPHYGSTLKNCATCHGRTVSATDPDDSAHHDTADSTAPTSGTCLTCHGTPQVDGATAAHGDLGTGIAASDCAHCHVGTETTHPTALAMVKPTLVARAARSGADLVVSGTLKRGTTALMGFTGWVQYKGPADTSWDASRVFPVQISATGTYTQTVAAPPAGTAFRVLFEGGTSGATTIRPVLARVATKLTFTVSPTSFTLGKRVKASGTVTPKRSGKVVLTVQRKVSTKWVKVTSSSRTLTATAAYSWLYKPGRKGTYRMQAKIAGTADFPAATSVWKTFRVK
jgi:hypothetical protein